MIDARSSATRDSFQVRIFSNNEFIIPEYKINLLNKSKKLINSIENTNSIIQSKKISLNVKTEKKAAKKIIKSKDKIKKTKSKKKIRTLWVRKKKKN